MQSPGMAFADSFMKGFSLMDAYYSRQQSNKRADDQAGRQAEAHTINMSNAGLQNKKLKREDWANQYQNIISDDTGNPIDIKNMTPDQLAAKKQQLTGFINGYEPIKADMLKQNPNRESVSSIDIIMDKQTNKPMMAVNFKMKDGSIKPMTTGSSSDPKEGVQLIGLDEADNMIKGYLGQDMGIKPSMKEARNTSSANAQNTLKHEQAKEIAHIKYDGTSKGTGGLGSKQIVTLKKDAYGLNNSNYGSAGLNGAFSFEGDKGQKRNIANVLVDHMVNSGRATDAGTVSAMAIQQVDQIYGNGGKISFNPDSKQWEAWDGSLDDQGKPTGVIPLNSDQKPEKADNPAMSRSLGDAKGSPENSDRMSQEEFNALKKRADNGDRDASIALSDAQNGYGDKGLPDSKSKSTQKKAPASYEEFRDAAMKVNKGVSEEAMREHYDKTYGKAEKAKEQARKNVDAKNSGLGNASAGPGKDANSSQDKKANKAPEFNMDTPLGRQKAKVATRKDGEHVIDIIHRGRDKELGAEDIRKAMVDPDWLNGLKVSDRDSVIEIIKANNK